MKQIWKMRPRTDENFEKWDVRSRIINPIQAREVFRDPSKVFVHNSQSFWANSLKSGFEIRRPFLKFIMKQGEITIFQNWQTRSSDLRVIKIPLEWP